MINIKSFLLKIMNKSRMNIFTISSQCCTMILDKATNQRGREREIERKGEREREWEIGKGDRESMQIGTKE